jgi:WD40 repeat protein
MYDDSCAVVVQNYYTPSNSISSSPTIYTGNKIYVMNLETFECELVVGEWISAVAISKEFIAGGTVDGNIDMWNRATGSFMHRIKAHQGVITDLQIHDDHLFSSSVDHMVRTWDLNTLTLDQDFDVHLNVVNSLYVLGDLMLTASDDHTVKLFNWRNGQRIATFTDDASVIGCAIGSDLATIVAGGKSGYVHILRTNKPLRKLLGNNV